MVKAKKTKKPLRKASSLLNYKGQLEQAARAMVLVHEPEKLIREIVQMFVQKIKLKHAAALVYNRQKQAYVLTVSGGEKYLRIPEGYARINPERPLIQLFVTRRNYLFEENGTIVYKKFASILKNRSLFKKEKGLKELLLGAEKQMEIYQVKVCLPVYIQDREFLGILMLGEKRSGREFTKEELNFFAALASDIAMAIKNAQLFEELSRANEELRLAQKKLEESQAARIHAAKMAMGYSQLGSFSHEITNKLQAIKTFIDCFPQTGYKLPEDMQRVFDVAASSVKEIEALFKTIMSFYAKIEDKRITLQDIGAVLEEVLCKLKEPFSQAKINLKLEVAKNLPLIEAKSTLAELFHHLLINSYYGMCQRQPRNLEVKISRIKDEKMPIEIKIADTGGDLTKEIGTGHLDIANIYSPERAPLGGIDFFLAYLIAEDHHGTFDIQSNRGIGTIFIVRLPLCQPKEIN